MKPYSFYYETPERDWPFLSRCFYAFIGGLICFLAKVLLRVEFEDSKNYLAEQKERMKRGEKGTILVCNHVSIAEPPVLVAFAWAHHFRLRPLHKIELEKNAFLRWLFSRIGGIPVHRGEDDLKLIRRSKKLLDAGDSLLIFPEGTRVKEDEAVAFHRGFALIAYLAKTRVYPAALTGALQLKPQHARLPRPHKVWFLFGKPLDPSDFLADDKKESARQLSEAAEKSVFALREKLRKDHPKCR